MPPSDPVVPLAGIRRGPLLPAVSLAITAAIFAIDALTTLHIAIAVMYVTVVLLSVNFLSRRGVLLTTVACMGLTVLGYVMSAGQDDTSFALARCGVSLAAIATTCFLALQNKAVTETLRAGQEALRRSQAFLAGTQRLSRTGSVSCTMPGTRMMWSDEAARIFGHEPGTTPSMELVLSRSHPEDRPAVLRSFQAAEAGEPVIDIEHRLLMSDGGIKHVRYLAHARPALNGDREYLGALVDITETREAEARLHRLRSDLAHASRISTLGELTASIAHEVNQPLAATMSNAEACLRWLHRPQPELHEARSSLERIIDETVRATNVLARIRALAQNREPRHDPLDFNELVRESLLLVNHEAGRQLCDIRTDLFPALPRVMGDGVQLQQVLINLIINGMQAMADVRDRPRVIAIRTRLLDDGAVCASVRDCGTGVGAADLTRMFDAFFTTRPHGMGMGLSISRSIVEAHEGRLWAENNADGPGATVLFTLPPRGAAHTLV
jgi:PAS domain S-box-containing protein